MSARFFIRALTRVLALSALLAVPATVARAHNGADLETDPCVSALGAGLIHFNAYQPDLEAKGHYCYSIPGSGTTIIVIDLVHRHLREVPTSVEIFKVGSTEEPTEPIARSPAEVRTHGVIETVASFEPGTYEAVVRTATEPVAERRLSFVIGANGQGDLARYFSLTLAAGLLSFVAYTRLRRRARG